jgi:Uma2 family endonuclease
MVLTAEQLEAIMPDATQLESKEPEMESSDRYTQLMLLVICLEWLWRNRSDYFIGANLTIYYSRQQLKTRDFRGPDFFLVKQTQKRNRNSWVVWEENGKYPNLIIELLSDSTARVDRNLKKELSRKDESLKTTGFNSWMKSERATSVAVAVKYLNKKCLIFP